MPAVVRIRTLRILYQIALSEVALRRLTMPPLLKLAVVPNSDWVERARLTSISLGGRSAYSYGL